MFSLYNLVILISFVYFSFFLEHFFVFFEDLFLIFAFITFISIVFLFISNATTTYFAARANYIKGLYLKLFQRRKEAVKKNMASLEYIYIKQDPKFIRQYAALVYLRYISTIKMQKEIEIIVNTTAAQNIFIEIQKQLTNELQSQIIKKYAKK